MPETMKSMRAVEKLRERDVHAVGGGAVDLEDTFRDLLHPERSPQRQGMTDGAGLDIRRDDGHLAQPPQRIREHVDALGPNAIVVGDQDARHGVYQYIRRAPVAGSCDGNDTTD